MFDSRCMAQRVKDAWLALGGEDWPEFKRFTKGCDLYRRIQNRGGAWQVYFEDQSQLMVFRQGSGRVYEVTEPRKPEQYDPPPTPVVNIAQIPVEELFEGPQPDRVETL